MTNSARLPVLVHATSLPVRQRCRFATRLPAGSLLRRAPKATVYAEASASSFPTTCGHCLKPCRGAAGPASSHAWRVSVGVTSSRPFQLLSRTVAWRIPTRSCCVPCFSKYGRCAASVSRANCGPIARRAVCASHSATHHVTMTYRRERAWRQPIQFRRWLRPDRSRHTPGRPRWSHDPQDGRWRFEVVREGRSERLRKVMRNHPNPGAAGFPAERSGVTRGRGLSRGRSDRRSGFARRRARAEGEHRIADDRRRECAGYDGLGAGAHKPKTNLNSRISM